jgi:hypothetical protein
VSAAACRIVVPAGLAVLDVRARGALFVGLLVGLLVGLVVFLVAMFTSLGVREAARGCRRRRVGGSRPS